MSAGALAATLAVAFVGGAGGAVLGPLVTHRLNRASRLAERRVEPYHRLVHAGRNLVEMWGHVPTRPGEPESPVWYHAIKLFHDAAGDADVVSTPELRNRVKELSQACASVRRHDPRTWDPERVAEWRGEFTATYRAAFIAYERLRDQVQLETRG